MNCPGRSTKQRRSGETSHWNCCLAARRTCSGRRDDRRLGAAFSEQSSHEPLSGWRVLIPRPADRSAALFGALQAVGARGVSAELISIAAPTDPGELDLRLVDLASGGYGWIGFTSANAVDAVLQRSAALGLIPPIPADTRVAAVGPATARALRSAGLPVDLVPPTGGSADALATIWPTARKGQAVLLPRSDIAAPALPQALAAKGYRVEAVTAYRTTTAPVPAWLAAELAGGLIDAVLFTSPSTVRALDGIEIDPATVLGAIGRPTATAMAQSGRTVDFTAGQPTATALVDGLLDAVGLRSRPPRSERQHDVSGSSPGLFPGLFPPFGPAGCAAHRRSGGSSRRPGCTPPTWYCRCSSRSR